ncbi:hypothetical protein PAMP_018875 [Pampus punctatissimus]
MVPGLHQAESQYNSKVVKTQTHTFSTVYSTYSLIFFYYKVGEGPSLCHNVCPFPTEADNSNLIYENDNHDPANIDPTRNNSYLPGLVHYMDGTQPTQSTIYPNPNQCNFERVESTRTKQRFHRELMSRFQASFSRHHYVNQEELRRQAASSQVQQQPQQQHRGSFIFNLIVLCSFLPDNI